MPCDDVAHRILSCAFDPAQQEAAYRLDRIDFGLDVQEAIEAPRWYHERGRTLGLEARFPEEARRALAGKGHEIEVLGAWDATTGGAQAIAVDANGVFAAGADPRREGVAAGY